jgi:hypothetical protein
VAVFQIESLGCSGFQMRDDVFDETVATFDDNMNVFGQDRAGKYSVPMFGDAGGESMGDGKGLTTIEMDIWIFQFCFGRFTQCFIVRYASHRAPSIGFRGPAESEQFPGADEIGP